MDGTFPLLLELALGLLLVLCTVLIHYEVLRLTSHWLPRLAIPTRLRIVVVILATFSAHMVEVMLFATAFYLLGEATGQAPLVGNRQGGVYDYLYFSLSNYTSLGLGDLYLRDALRLLSAVETLIGLLMIAWSASFTYLAMERFWGLHGRAR